MQVKIGRVDPCKAPRHGEGVKDRILGHGAGGFVKPEFTLAFFHWKRGSLNLQNRTDKTADAQAKNLANLTGFPASAGCPRCKSADAENLIKIFICNHYLLLPAFPAVAGAPVKGH